MKDYRHPYCTIGILPALLAWVIPALAVAGTAGTPATMYRLSNGMEVVLKENHASPMIASVVFVRSGAKYESDFNNGATHFLEHLLFNGTATRSQEQIADRIKNLGGYINAFTRKELTAYMSLVPAEHIHEALDIQQDMLFNSILPEERFPKERGIVIEEIRRDRDDPNHIAESFYDQWAYRGSPYARPVLGYENLIATIPRADIMEYYQSFYQPNNMILLLIGDFETSAMREMLEETFGRHAARPIPPRKVIVMPSVTEKTVKRTTAKVADTHIDFHFRLPGHSDPDYPALSLLTEILNERSMSPLHARLLDGDPPLASTVGASLETQDEFTALRISIRAGDTAHVDAILAAVPDIIAGLRTLSVPSDDIQAVATRLRVEDIFLRERLHYYAIMKAPLLVTTGYEFMDALPERMARVKQSELQNAAARHLTGLEYIATVVSPHAETMATENVPARITRSAYATRTLANGLKLIVRSNPDSRVFAINILGRHRSAIEPEDLTGISDFVNRMLVSGTATRSADDISRELTAIGAELTTNDNPYIPYDDHYTTPQYTFVKFGTIDDFAARGSELLADVIGNSVFPEAEIQKTRSQVMGILGMAANSPSQVCRDLFYDALFGGGALARPVLGTAESIARFTPQNLKAHLHTLYSPENMILTCVTNLTAEEALTLLEKSFGALRPGTPPAVDLSPPARPAAHLTRHAPMDKEQITITLGGPVAGATSGDAAALRLAIRILSSRLGAELRERQGLAYSVGASMRMDRDFGWFTATMGTGHQNLEIARQGMLAEIKRLSESEPSAEEFETARNTLRGSALTASLSRITQAYEMGLNEYLGLGFDWSDSEPEVMNKVTPAQVREAARRWLDPDNVILATVGRTP